jgi:hypothetical protein
MEASNWIVAQRELEMRRKAASELPCLALADDVSQLLADLAQDISIAPSDGEPGASQLQKHALWIMAIIALRALRAAMQVLAAGYEDQAVGYQRLIDELHNRAQIVHGDKSGSYARDWLRGKGLAKGAKLAGQDFWEFMSGPVHANIRAVNDWLAISEDDGTTRVVIGPERRRQMANAALVYMASEGRDLANLLAIHDGRTLDLEELDGKIVAARSKYIPEP